MSKFIRNGFRQNNWTSKPVKITNPWLFKTNYWRNFSSWDAVFWVTSRSREREDVCVCMCYHSGSTQCEHQSAVGKYVLHYRPVLVVWARYEVYALTLLERSLDPWTLILKHKKRGQRLVFSQTGQRSTIGQTGQTDQKVYTVTLLECSLDPWALVLGHRKKDQRSIKILKSQKCNTGVCALVSSLLLSVQTSRMPAQSVNADVDIQKEDMCYPKPKSGMLAWYINASSSLLSREREPIVSQLNCKCKM